MGGKKKRAAIKQRHVGARPDRGRGQDRAIQMRRMGIGQRRQQHRAAHALPHRIDRQAGEFFAQRGGEVREIASHHIAARPFAGMRRGAEAALVIGIGGDALPRPVFRGHGEGFGIIAHAVQADDQGARLGRVPMAQRQHRAVGGGEAVRADHGRPVVRPMRRQQGRAGCEHEQRGGEKNFPCHLFCIARKAGYGCDGLDHRRAPVAAPRIEGKWRWANRRARL